MIPDSVVNSKPTVLNEVTDDRKSIMKPFDNSHSGEAAFVHIFSKPSVKYSPEEDSSMSGKSVCDNSYVSDIPQTDGNT